jgi:AcrR family transcriptional regulator
MQKRSQETKNRILESAMLLFSQSGYETTGVADICESAGVSKGAFYHHFQSKQEVFLELLRNWSITLENGLDSLRIEEKNVPSSLLGMSGMMQFVLESARGQLPMFIEFWIQAIRDPIIWRESLLPYERFLAFFSDLIRTGIEEGSLKEFQPELEARIILALILGVLLQSLLDNQNIDWSDATRFGMQILLEGIQK